MEVIKRPGQYLDLRRNNSFGFSLFAFERRSKLEI